MASFSPAQSLVSPLGWEPNNWYQSDFDPVRGAYGESRSIHHGSWLEVVPEPSSPRPQPFDSDLGASGDPCSTGHGLLQKAPPDPPPHQPISTEERHRSPGDRAASLHEQRHRSIEGKFLQNNDRFDRMIDKLDRMNDEMDRVLEEIARSRRERESQQYRNESLPNGMSSMGLQNPMLNWNQSHIPNYGVDQNPNPMTMPNVQVSSYPLLYPAQNSGYNYHQQNLYPGTIPLGMNFSPMPASFGNVSLGNASFANASGQQFPGIAQMGVSAPSTIGSAQMSVPAYTTSSTVPIGIPNYSNPAQFGSSSTGIATSMAIHTPTFIPTNQYVQSPMYTGMNFHGVPITEMNSQGVHNPMYTEMNLHGVQSLRQAQSHQFGQPQSMPIFHVPMPEPMVTNHQHFPNFTHPQPHVQSSMPAPAQSSMPETGGNQGDAFDWQNEQKSEEEARKKENEESHEESTNSGNDEEKQSNVDDSAESYISEESNSEGTEEVLGLLTHTNIDSKDGAGDSKEEIAPLDHNKYRSFQGLTCLMQISTRTEDFFIDTQKLCIHVDPYLRELFSNPLKRKVMHGADCDILWLQRDFGIYVGNLFNTGLASRVMQLEEHSPEYVLLQFCGVTVNKEYQNSDWGVCPIPEQMLKYAIEDTHHLLHLYDLMMMEMVNP